MRRFVKTFLVRRRGQFTVIQDGEKRVFEVWHWSAEHGLSTAARLPYARDDRRAEGYVRGAAIREAERLATSAAGGAEHVFPLGSGEVSQPVDLTAERLGHGNNRGRRRRQLQEQP
jgi:hypothetical protein